MKTWVLFFLCLVVFSFSDFYTDHPRWQGCSFAIDLWEMTYNCSLGLSVVAWLYAATLTRFPSYRLHLKRLFGIVFPSFQAILLVYLIWGTLRTSHVTSSEPDCVPPNQLPVAKWKVWAGVISIYVSWVVFTVLVGVLVSWVCRL